MRQRGKKFVAVTVQPPASPSIRLLHEFDGGDTEANEKWAYEETLRWVESMGLDGWAVEFSNAIGGGMSDVTVQFSREEIRALLDAIPADRETYTADGVLLFKAAQKLEAALERPE